MGIIIEIHLTFTTIRMIHTIFSENLLLFSFNIWSFGSVDLTMETINQNGTRVNAVIYCYEFKIKTNENLQNIFIRFYGLCLETWKSRCRKKRKFIFE